MLETLKNKEIFELYYSMGEGRSLSKLREELMSPKCPQNVPSLKTLKRWSKAFNCQDRIELRDIDNGKKLEAKTDKAVVNSKADYRALIRKTVDLYKKKLDDGKIIISRPQDLDILAKLDLTMMGEATERGELNITNAKQKFIDRINNIAKRAGEGKSTK